MNTPEILFPLPPRNRFETSPSLRDGIVLEKGVTLTGDFLEKNESLVQKYIQFFSVYPDLFLDLIKPKGSGFNLFFYQRVILRAIMRHKEVYLTAPRAASKSALSIWALFLSCMFSPGSRRFIAAPGKGQSVTLARPKIFELYSSWPLLRHEIVGDHLTTNPGNYGANYIELKFKNGSLLSVIAASNATRGDRRHGGLIDEVREHDETMLNEVILPTMNVSRRLPNNEVNPDEPFNQQTIYMTSAGSKLSFAYQRLLDVVGNAIMFPKNSIVLSLDYRIPVLHGLLDRDFATKLRLSPTFKEASFATEYMTLWQATSTDSWYSFDKMLNHRKLKNPELQAKYREGSSHFYLLSVDVGRISDSTIVCVFKVFPQKNGVMRTSLVNIIPLGLTDHTKPLPEQAKALKRIIALYNPASVVIDTNGLGIGLGDEMVRPQLDIDGTILPAYAFLNDPHFKKTQPLTAPQLLYSLKATADLNSQIHSNTYARISSGLVTFLISEQDARTAILSTKKGAKLSIEDRVKRLRPHELTSSLFLEMSNLRLKAGGSIDKIALEQINSRLQKDKYSAFSYGLWRIKELEDAGIKEALRRNRFEKQDGTNGMRKLVFFSEGRRK